MRPAILAAVCIAFCSGEIVDRVAANIGRQVITETQVVEEVRIQAFIQGDPVDLSKENRRKALDRLVDQALVRREFEFTRFAAVAETDITPAMKDLRARYATEQQYQDDLKKYDIDAEQLKQHVSWSVTMLRFIEYRFQPSVQITPALLRQEYERQAADWLKTHGTEMPPLEEVQGDIEKIVRQHLIDAGLDRWLGEVRTQNEILFHGEYKE